MPDTDSSQHPNLYRAILKKGWFDKLGQQVTSAAFDYRPHGDEQAISVLKSVNCAPGSRENCTGSFDPCFGEFILPTDGPRTLGLTVEDDDPDAADYNPNHASIVGIPVHPETEEEAQRAEDLRTALARMSRLHYDRENRFDTGLPQ